jgi:1-deoxy-D-xylulose-5-phosphate reductoisomerase
VKHLVILGSTGSIGRNTLNVVSQFPDRFRVVGLAAGTNIRLLKEQILRFKPKWVSVVDRDVAKRLKERLPARTRTRVWYGKDGVGRVATMEDGELVVSAMVGAAGLIPTLAAVRAGKDIAIANKETLVMGGEIVMQEVKARGVRFLPIDSEHCAIHQCLAGHRKEDLKRIILTASGGPFLETPRAKLKGVTPSEALAHPTWRMGRKVTIDSATLMNKGLEVIEARWMFNVPIERIDVTIHPESLIHSMVEYSDGSIIAQMSAPDMKGPIAYALSYPERLTVQKGSLDLVKVGGLTFRRPDVRRFPALKLAYRAIEAGGTMPAVLNAANEVAVQAFLDGAVGFLRIAQVIGKTMELHGRKRIKNLQDILEADRWARDAARKLCGVGSARAD